MIRTTASPLMKPRLLKSRDAAHYLCISLDKLRSLVQRGEIPYIPGGNPSAPWLFDIRDLDTWIDKVKIRIA